MQAGYKFLLPAFLTLTFGKSRYGTQYRDVKKTITTIRRNANTKIPLFYARACDIAGPNEKKSNKALEYLRKGFTENCNFSYFLPDGSEWGTAEGVNGFTELAYNFLSTYQHTQHAMPNILVEDITSNSARIRTYGVARHFNFDLSMDCAPIFYIDEVILENDTWKSKDRKGYFLSFNKYVDECSLI